jgi:hypothetical protein
MIYLEGELYVSRVTSGCLKCPYVAFLLLPAGSSRQECRAGEGGPASLAAEVPRGQSLFQSFFLAKLVNKGRKHKKAGLYR